MELSPCPCVVSLNDGSNHTLFQFRDFLELVDQKMGMDARKFLEERIGELEEAADYTTQKVESDLTSYESSLDSNRTAFQDIEEVCRGLISDFNKETGRNRVAALEPWRNKIEEIIKIINNQI